MSETGVNAAEAAIYSVSAGGLALLLAATLFVWLALRSSRQDGASRHPPAE